MQILKMIVGIFNTKLLLFHFGLNFSKKGKNNIELLVRSEALIGDCTITMNNRRNQKSIREYYLRLNFSFSAGVCLQTLGGERHCK